mgnify:CR=1 FL=1
MSIISKAKIQIKIVLDSYNTSSFSGRQFDAVYNLDFNRIVMNQEDLDRPYIMTFSFRSIEAASATNTITNTDVFQVALDFGKGINCVYDRNQFNIVGLLQVQNGFTAYSGTACPTFFYCSEQDNAGVIVRNLRGISSCRLTVIQSSNNTVFNATNNAGVNTASKYVCCITLTEL